MVLMKIFTLFVPLLFSIVAGASTPPLPREKTLYVEGITIQYMVPKDRVWNSLSGEIVSASFTVDNSRNGMFVVKDSVCLFNILLLRSVGAILSVRSHFFSCALTYF